MPPDSSTLWHEESSEETGRLENGITQHSAEPAAQKLPWISERVLAKGGTGSVPNKHGVDSMEA